MKQGHISFAAAFVAATFTLSACGGEAEVIDPNVDPQAEELAKAPPVELPPAIQASRTYRCRDNSLVYIDFYTNNTATIRSSKEGAQTKLVAEGGNPPYVAEGYSVSANAEQINVTAPGKGSQSCRA